jgi:GTPase
VREIVPVSALKGSGVETLQAALAALLPEGPFYFPGDEVSDQPLHVRLAELVREAALKHTREEVPHSIEVHVEDVTRRDDGLTFVRAVLWVESASQKTILIGRGGSMVRAVGTSARKEIERELDGRAHLDLTVKVRKGWRRDEGLLDRLGIEA